ncbi:MAG TPA: excinuclease ABC subunit UvrC, partial [Gammaproteobacteria bacterium]|nr:excinuclease ABC subunit UvrC [Gammaproteobacteria bacterium]
MSDEHTTSTPEGPATEAFDAQAFLKTVSEGPGIYRMFDDSDTVIYVGKARNLKKRLTSYFRRNLPDAKTRVLVSHIRRIETTLTNTETEALLLESNLIKSLRPRYNVVYRDDKSYPWIYLSSHQAFPRLGFYRGARREQGTFYGPYPSSASVRETLRLLQKIFPVRQCEDAFFRNRSRPCLQYQIKRCTAPCVGLISEADYAEDVRLASLFLAGKSDDAIQALVARMEAASQAQAYEQAAVLRDQIAALRRVQETQYIDSRHGDVDVLAAAIVGGIGCVQLFTIRGGRNLGNRAWFPSHDRQASETELLDAFVLQHYLADRRGGFIPDEILLSHASAEGELLAAALSERKGRKVQLRVPQRGERRQWLGMALRNAEHAASSRLNSRATL